MNEPAYMDYLGVGRAEARVLAYLRECSDKTSPRSVDAIASAAGIGAPSVKVAIAHLRGAMDTEAIDTVPGRRGRSFYLLTEVGVEECRRAVVEYRKAVAA